MKKALAFVGVGFGFVLLTGCVTPTQVSNSVASLGGQHIDYAIQKIGYPTQEMNVAGRKAYIWVINKSGALVLPQTNTTTGWVGNTMYTGYTNTTSVTPYNWSCKLELTVDSSEYIVGTRWAGQMGACASLASISK